MQLTMTADDGNMEPTDDLGLSLGYSNQCIQTRLNNDPGAGVNADSGLGIAFVASAPLFELVWSPHEGLSLKCADNSLTEKKSSLPWDVEPAHTVLSPQQSIASKATNDEKNMTTSREAVSMDSEVGEPASLARSPRSDGILPVDESSHKQHSGQENQKTTDFLTLRTSDLICRTRKNEPLSKEYSKAMTIDPGGRTGDVVSGSQTSGVKVALPSEVQTVKQDEAFEFPVQNLISAGRISLAIKNENENRMKAHGSVSVFPLDRLESTAETGLRHPLSEVVCGQIEEAVPRNKSVQIESYARKSRNHFYRRKGKERALSDGDVNERMSEGDDSRESIESCNSVGLLSTGKRQWNFEQQLFVGGKRFKRQIEESPTSTNFVGRDSSFMNWIVNMVKGLTKSIQDTAPLTPAPANCSHEHECHSQETIACNKSHDPGSRNKGFQTIFESLYCPNTKLQETQISKGNYPIGDSKELVIDSKTCNAVNPIFCSEENENFSKQFLVFGNRGSLTTQPRALSETIASCKDSTAKNKTSCHLACVKAKNKASSSDSSLGKGKTDSADNNPFNSPSKGKTIHNIGYRNDPPRSLWITRYSPKRAVAFSSDCARFANVQNRVDFSIDQQDLDAKEYSTENPNVVGKEMPVQVPNTRASPKKRVPGYDDQNSGNKLKSINSSKFKGAEAVASVFARRLDIKDGITCAMITCSFCGRNGHSLYDCLEITQRELEDLLRNMTSNDGAEEPPYLCIRCFQPDHWAVSCPLASLRKRHQSECGTFLVNHCNASKVQLAASNEICTRMLGAGAGANGPQVAREHTFFTGKKPHTDTDFSLNLKQNGIMTFYEWISNSKHIASIYGKTNLNEIHASPLCNFFNKQFSDVPEGMFDAIRRLRLSRMNILKWMQSQVPLSQIDGFFVRLRLGKHKGLGSAYYRVACVTGAQREISPQNSKTSISVIIGGIDCLVESQFVSNHDFLEDELMAWWCTTSRNSGKIPSQDHLNLKLEERKRLGF